MLLDVRVIPRAKKTALAGTRDGSAGSPRAVVLRVNAPPVDGAANDAVVEFFAALFDIPRRNIQIVSGERSRHKRLSIDGVAPERVRDILGG